MEFVPRGDLIDSSYCTQENAKERVEQDVDRLVPKGAEGILKNISQWGLKEVWLGCPPRPHSRWDHTKGALTVALLWYRHLIDQNLAKHSLRPLQIGEEALKKLVLIGVALHDIGHLPFAHLLGEVLESINWVPEGKGLSGLEQEVLQARLENDFKDLWNKLASDLSCRPDHLKLAVTDLISGRHGLPWAQAIVNSPIDADKLDYVQRDSQFLRLSTHLAGARLPPTDAQKAKWLAEFFASQTVNHAGLLCLSGRSAVFAADLMRDRIYLYDRFYLSPEVRTAERMAFEIVQQFLIRAVMSEDFRMRTIDEIGGGSDGEISGLGSRMEGASGGEVRKSKCQLAVQILKLLAPKAEGEFMEFEPLKIMYDLLSCEKNVDAGAKSLWAQCFNRLLRLKEKVVPLDTLAREVLVREPLVLSRRQYDLALEILRPLQHVYARHVLIDLVKLPRALGAGRRWRLVPGRRADEVDWSILVPEGPISRWGAGSKACRPLTDEAVRELERPYARVLVVAPFGSDLHSEYIWDRVRAALLEGGVELIKKARGT
jgi:hypothetical protein